RRGRRLGRTRHGGRGRRAGGAHRDHRERETTMMDKRTRALGVSLAALALLLGACSDDSSNDAATGTTAARAEPSAQGDLTIFCDSAIESETMFEYGPESEGDAPPTDEAIAAFASELRPILEEMESSAPDEVADDAKTF